MGEFELLTGLVGLAPIAAAARFGIPAFRNLKTSQRLAESGTQVEGRVVSVFRKVCAIFVIWGLNWVLGALG